MCGVLAGFTHDSSDGMTQLFERLPWARLAYATSPATSEAHMTRVLDAGRWRNAMAMANDPGPQDLASELFPIPERIFSVQHGSHMQHPTVCTTPSSSSNYLTAFFIVSMSSSNN